MRTHQAVKHRKVASREYAFCGTATVKAFPSFAIHYLLSEQGFPERFNRGITKLYLRHVQRHGGMQGLDAKMPVNMGMQHGNIAVTHYPFRVAVEFYKIKFIYDSDRSIAAPGTYDRSHRGIVHHKLKILSSLGIAPRKLVLTVKHIRAENNFQPPSLEKLHGRMYLVEVDTARRGKNGDLVAFLQKRGLNHNGKCKKLICIFAHSNTDYGKTGL